MNKHFSLTLTVSLLAARAFAADSITVLNPSFQANLPGGVGYGTPDSWAPAGGVGVNNGGMPFADNGMIPDNDQVAFLQGTSSLTQNLSGFSIGDLYWVQGFANARSGGDNPTATLTLAGTTILPPTTISPVGGANAYNFVNLPWVATATSGDLAGDKTDAQDVEVTGGTVEAQAGGEQTPHLVAIEQGHAAVADKAELIHERLCHC